MNMYLHFLSYCLTDIKCAQIRLNDNEELIYDYNDIWTANNDKLFDEMLTYFNNLHLLSIRIIRNDNLLAVKNYDLINKFHFLSRTKNADFYRFLESEVIENGRDLTLELLKNNLKILAFANKYNFNDAKIHIVELIKNNKSKEMLNLSIIFYKYLNSLFIYDKKLSDDHIKNLKNIPDELFYYKGSAVDTNYLEKYNSSIDNLVYLVRNKN